MAADAGKVIRDVLVADTAFTAIASTRVYPNRADRASTVPYATYQQVARENINIFQGVPTLWRSTVQLNLYASTYSNVKALAAASYAALQGAIPSGSLGIQLVTEEDMFTDDSQVHWVRQDWDVWICTS